MVVPQPHRQQMKTKVSSEAARVCGRLFLLAMESANNFVNKKNNFVLPPFFQRRFCAP
jgi:hypothetical protein